MFTKRIMFTKIEWLKKQIDDSKIIKIEDNLIRLLDQELDIYYDKDHIHFISYALMNYDDIYCKKDEFTNLLIYAKEKNNG